MHRIGVITEYNPFHNGHAFQLETIRQRYPESLLIIAMSGNVVQRGEFAVLDKWQRAKLALQAQADLVVELPLWASVQSADHFARWSIDLLARLGVNHLVFGTHGVETHQLQQALDWIQMNEKDLDQAIQKFLQEGLSYPASRQAAIDHLDPEGRFVTFNMSEGNSLLGFQYLWYNAQLNQPMTVEAIHRHTGYWSGSQIRAAILKGNSVSHWVPEASNKELINGPNRSMEDYFNLIKYQILTKSVQDLGQIQGMREGFEHLLKKVIQNVVTYDELVSQLTSKRWARSSVQRLLMQVLLNISKEEWTAAIADYQKFAKVRILGYSEKGRMYLKNQRMHGNLQLFSNLTQEIFPQYQWIYRADEIYNLPFSHLDNQNLGKFPIIQKNPVIISNKR